MKRKKNSKILLGLLLAVIGLGIGYAAVTGVNLFINGSATAKASGQQEDFNVHFDNLTSTGNYITYTEEAATDSLVQSYVDEKHVTGASESTDKAASITVANNQLSATVSVSNMTAVGDTVTLTIPVINESDGINANLSTTIENGAEEYFDVTAEPAVNKLNGNGATTTVTVTVSVKKVPAVNDVNGTFTVTLTANPED